MQCVITYATDMYLSLSKISPEIKIFNFGYLSSGQYILPEQGCEDPWLVFEAKKGPRAKKYGKH
jgi:hypothetical protein